MRSWETSLLRGDCSIKAAAWSAKSPTPPNGDKNEMCPATPHQIRIAITGMAAITPHGDSLEALHQALMQGRSGIRAWDNPLYCGCISKVGGDLSGFDADGKLQSLRASFPDEVFRRTRRLMANSPRTTAVALLAGVEAFASAGLCAANGAGGCSAVLAGNSPHELYKLENWRAYEADHGGVDVSLGVKEMDTDALACVTEALGITGPAYSTGGACAAGNIALRSASDEIRHHGAKAVLVVAPPHELTPATLHSLASLGALATGETGGAPAQVSRPFDLGRCGFVPAAGAAALVLEDLEHARKRGAHIYAELLGVGATTSGTRSPTPALEHMAEAMERALAEARVDKDRIGYVSAHATSTRLGDAAEAAAIHKVFGSHAADLKVNALKSMLGHQLSASALVEVVACVLELRAGVLYPSINIERPDPEIGLDVCANRLVECKVDYLMKNAFGFGGVNTACVIGRCG